eukprot:3779677-Rhodomonas_salina.2
MVDAFEAASHKPIPYKFEVPSPDSPTLNLDLSMPGKTAVSGTKGVRCHVWGCVSVAPCPERSIRRAMSGPAHSRFAVSIPSCAARALALTSAVRAPG